MQRVFNSVKEQTNNSFVEVRIFRSVKWGISCRLTHRYTRMDKLWISCVQSPKSGSFLQLLQHQNNFWMCEIQADSEVECCSTQKGRQFFLLFCRLSLLACLIDTDNHQHIEAVTLSSKGDVASAWLVMVTKCYLQFWSASVVYGIGRVCVLLSLVVEKIWVDLILWWSRRALSTVAM